MAWMLSRHYLILALCILKVFSAQIQAGPLRRRLSRPKATKSVQLYATMLIEYNSVNMESIQTTTLDSSLANELLKDSNNKEEESDKEEAQVTPTGDLDGSYDSKKGGKSMTEATTAIPQSLVDEFIFTTKQAAAQKSYAPASVGVASSLVALSIVFLFL